MIKKAVYLGILLLICSSCGEYYKVQKSINERKGERYRNTIDEYYAYINEYPDGKYKKEAESIFNDASKYIDSEE